MNRQYRLNNVVEAIQWTCGNWEDIVKFVGRADTTKNYYWPDLQSGTTFMIIPERIGVGRDDYIIRKPNGHLDVLNERLFNALFEKVTEGDYEIK